MFLQLFQPNTVLGPTMIIKKKTFSPLATWNSPLLGLKLTFHKQFYGGSLLTWWRSSCQTSASDPSWSLPRSVSWWLRLTTTQAPPTSRPSHGCDPSLVGLAEGEKRGRVIEWVRSTAVTDWSSGSINVMTFTHLCRSSPLRTVKVCQHPSDSQRTSSQLESRTAASAEL